ncbi:MAG: peptidase M61 [Methylibium sp. NZG]|nr:MAG: peptidase M61 [Methylibium sp. NZG]
MITYQIGLPEPHTHSFHVTLTIPAPHAEQRVSLPVWIPGSYLVREFARHLSGLQATHRGKPVAVQQIDKATWLVRCKPGAALTLSYRVYAFDTSVRAAFLDAQRGFFNGTSLCLRAEGFEQRLHRLELPTLPEGWQVATSLPALSVDAAGRGAYGAADYDELVDHPVELGTFWRGTFEVRGAEHELVVAGALPDFDGERLLADTQRICEAQIAFWHGAADVPPFAHYVFLLNAVDDSHGGLEHRASTALIAPRRDLPQRGKPESVTLSDGYVSLLGLISHEYFHTWNVKRLRPAEFARYDYTRENYTELLWFFEGFTSYYDDLLLRRAGLIDDERYLRLLAKTVSGVLATPGRQVQSVAQASFDAWVKYYRTDENTPNATISYYTKGALVALALDLSLRSEAGAAKRGGRAATLDTVMRHLWAASAGGPISEADIAAALQHVGRRSFAAALAAWVHGTGELPLQPLLAAAGVAWQPQSATLAQRLGLRVSESALTGVKVSHVLAGGAAQQAGLSAGDELLALDGWRLRRLDDALRLLAPGQAATLLAARDQRVLSLALTLPSTDAGNPLAAVSLALQDKPAQPALALRKAWLGT